MRTCSQLSAAPATFKTVCPHQGSTPVQISHNMDMFLFLVQFGCTSINTAVFTVMNVHITPLFSKVHSPTHTSVFSLVCTHIKKYDAHIPIQGYHDRDHIHFQYRYQPHTPLFGPSPAPFLIFFKFVFAPSWAL
jgi:hypothetical protein